MGRNAFWEACARWLRSKKNKPPEPNCALCPRLQQLAETITSKARAAQTGAFTFSFVGLLILALAFSTTDLDIITDHAQPLPEINLLMPAAVTFTFGPLLFVALHAFTLIRYDMLADDIETFFAQVRRNHCADNVANCLYWHLLPNVEFVCIFTNELFRLGGKRQKSKANIFVNLTGWMMFVIIPLFILAVIEISALRMQSPIVTRTQKATIAFDFCVLFWFSVRYHARLRRIAVAEPKPDDQNTQKVERAVDLTPSLGAPLALVDFRRLLHIPNLTRVLLHVALISLIPTLLFIYGDIPPPIKVNFTTFRQTNALLQGRNAREDPNDAKPLTLLDLLKHPLDLGLCPNFYWGCRYLTVAGRVLSTKLQPNQPDLRNRNLRYADFNAATAVGVSFWDSDLSGATFKFARLDGAKFDRATLNWAQFRHAHMTGATFRNSDLRFADLSMSVLKRANLEKAKLAHARLFRTNLDGADLTGGKLQAATLFRASLAGTNFTGSDLTFAFFGAANLPGADLQNANMPGAFLEGAHLWGADLRDAILDGADLRDANLFASDLTDASLYGARLNNTDLWGTDLGGARLYHADTGPETTIDYADLGGADATTQLPTPQAKTVEDEISKVGVYGDFVSVVNERIAAAASPPKGYRHMQFKSPQGTILADRYPEMHFPSLKPKWLMRMTPGTTKATDRHQMSVRGYLLVAGSDVTCESKNSSNETVNKTISVDIIGNGASAQNRLYVCWKTRGTKIIPRHQPPFFLTKALAEYYDRQLVRTLPNTKPGPCRDANSAQACEFGLAERALEEASDDDQFRNEAFAYASVRMIFGWDGKGKYCRAERAAAARLELLNVALNAGPQSLSDKKRGQGKWDTALKSHAEITTFLKDRFASDDRNVMATTLFHQLPRLVALASKYHDDLCPAGKPQNHRSRMSQRSNATPPAPRAAPASGHAPRPRTAPPGASPRQSALPPSPRSDPPPTAQTSSHR